MRDATLLESARSGRVIVRDTSMAPSEAAVLVVDDDVRGLGLERIYELH